MDATYLAFDYGDARIGIAVGQSVTGNARPLATVACNRGVPDWQQVDRLVDDWQPTALVVGIPVHVDGGEQPVSARARAFAGSLATRYSLQVHEADERLSSRAAEERIAAGRAGGTRRRTRKGDVDRMAAAFILEDWLQQQGETS